MIERIHNVGPVRVASLWNDAGELQALSMVCRACGCKEWEACAGGCAWAELDLCTSCAPGLFVTPEQEIALEQLREEFIGRGILSIL